MITNCVMYFIKFIDRELPNFIFVIFEVFF